MNSGLVIGLFPAISFFLNSFLHTIYVSQELDKQLRLGLPYAENLGIKTSTNVGYAGAVVLLVIWVGLFSTSFPFGITEPLFTQRTATWIVASTIVAGLILHLSQIIGGSSWTKLALDTGGILLTGFLLVLWYNSSGITVWNVVPTYLTLLFGLFTIGSAWVNYQTRSVSHSKVKFVQNTSTDGTESRFTHEPDSESDPVPPFASIAYFVISGGYLIVGSGLIILYIGVIAN